jgi:hypothetical protein
MSQKRENPFDSVESAREFISMFSEVIAEAKQEVEEHLQQELNAETSRSRDALRIAHYNLVKLESHMNSSGRILNDLRSLRRLLFGERATAGQLPIAIEPSSEIVAAKPLAPVPAPGVVTPPRFVPSPSTKTNRLRVNAATTSQG